MSYKSKTYTTMKKSPITISNNPVITVKFGSATVSVKIEQTKKGKVGIKLEPIAPSKDIKNGDNIPNVPPIDGIKVLLDFTSVESINVLRWGLDIVERRLVADFINS